jgi:hypothetical protein
MDEKKYGKQVMPNEHGSYIDDDKERIAVQLSLGKRKPQNADEQVLLDEINKMKAEGKMIDIPYN